GFGEHTSLAWAPVSCAISAKTSTPDSTSVFSRASSVSFLGANSLQKTKQICQKPSVAGRMIEPTIKCIRASPCQKNGTLPTPYICPPYALPADHNHH